MLYLGAANVVSSVFGVIMMIYLARTLMPQGLGHIAYAISIVTYLSGFVDLGLSTYGVREVARNPASVSEYVSNIVSIRLIAAAALVLILVLITVLSDQPYKLKILMIETGLMLFMTALATEWAYQGLEKMNMVFISLAATSILQMFMIFTLVKGSEDMLRVPLIYFLGAAPIIILFLKKLGCRFKIASPDTRRIKIYLSSSLIIWAIAMFAQVYNNLDIFILGLFRQAEEVGYFALARRVVGGITILIVFLSNALLPRLSAAFNKDDDEFERSTHKFLVFSACLTFFVIIPALFFTKDLIRFTVGTSYSSAALPLNIMLGGVILVLFNLPYSTGLIASHLEKEVLKQVIASALLSLSLNFILIPRYGMLGSSVSFLMAEALALVWVLHIYKTKRLKVSLIKKGGGK
jgi:O-antigen/teichoic acid export membrane protein